MRSYFLPLMISLSIAVIFTLSGCGTPALAPAKKTTKPAAASPAAPAATAAAFIRPTPSLPEIMPLRVKPSLSAAGFSLNLQTVITNPTPNKLEISGIKVSTVTPGGKREIQGNYPGTIIESASSANFNYEIPLNQSLLSETSLTLELETQTLNTPAPLPLKTTAQINISDTLRKLIVPLQMNLQAGLTRVLQYGPQTLVEALASGSLHNPNPIDLNFSQLELLIKDKTGAASQYESFEGKSIPANGDYDFKSTLRLPLAVLNQTSLTASARTNIQLMNYIQPVNTARDIAVPKMPGLVKVPQLTLNVESAWNADNLYVVTVKAQIQNDNEFPFTAEDFYLKFFNNTLNKQLKAETMTKNLIQGIPGSNTRSVIFRFTYNKIDLGKGFEAAFTGDTLIGLDGVTEKIPLSAKTIYKLVP